MKIVSESNVFIPSQTIAINPEKITFLIQTCHEIFPNSMASLLISRHWPCLKCDTNNLQNLKETTKSDTAVCYKFKSRRH